MLPSFLAPMFHVKHSRATATPGATAKVTPDSPPRTMFHVKHRRLIVGVAGLLALVSAGCANIQSPEGWASPVEVDGDVLVQSASGQLTLVDPATGAISWTYPDEDSSDRAFYATPIIEGNAAFVADYSGRVMRLTLGEGAPAEAWAVDLGAHIVATPLLEAGTLYVPTANGRIAVIDAATGSVTDTLRTSDRRIWGAPALQSGTLYLGDLDNGSTVAINASTGDVVWEQEISGPTAADLALDGDLLLVGAFDQRLHALEVASGGNERWAFAGDGWFLARPLVRDGVVYAVTMNGLVYAIDRATGAQVWAFEPGEGAQFRAAPVLAGDTLIVAARDGRVFALNRASGEVEWSQDVTTEGNLNANPFIVDNNIYLVTSRHDLVRVDASNQGAFQAVPLTAAGDE